VREIDLPPEIRIELSDCLDRLKWIIAGVKAGGIAGWSRVPEQAPKQASGQDAPLSQPPSAEPCEARTGEAGGDGETKRPRLETQLVEAALDEVGRELSGCTRCRLHSARKSLVFGEGSAESGIVFVGEGPGFEEDQQGRPFVGRAGKLLDKMIQAMGYSRTDVYICNVVKCRPPENRTPQPDEIESCSPFLIKQISALNPKVICALGASAAQSLLGSGKPISQLRGKIHLWRGIPLICTYHPAYLLRNPVQKAAAWQDLKAVLKILAS